MINDNPNSQLNQTMNNLNQKNNDPFLAGANIPAGVFEKETPKKRVKESGGKKK